MVNRILFLILATSLVLSLVGPSLASDRKDRNENRQENKNRNENRPDNRNRNENRPDNRNRNENRPDNRNRNENRPDNRNRNENRPDNRNRNENRPDNRKEQDKIERERRQKVDEKWKEAKKEIVDYVRDIKNEVKDTISAAVIDKIKEKFDKINKDDSPQDSSKDTSKDSDSREDRKRYRALESAIGKEIENLAKEVKSKIVDQVLKRKEFTKATVEEKIQSIGQALENIKSEDAKVEEASVDVKADAAEEKKVLKTISSELEAAIEDVIVNEVNGSAEPSSTANGAVARLLLHKLLREFQPDVDALRDSWKGFASAELTMKEKAKQLHATEIVDGEPKSTFTFEKLNSFKASLKEMLEKKKSFVEKKIKLKDTVLLTLRNMSLVHQEKTGQAFSYVEFLESVLNGTIQLPQVLSDLFKEIKGAVEEVTAEEEDVQVAPEIVIPASSDAEVVPADDDITTPPTEEIPEESSVIEILNSVQQVESDLSSQISALEQDAKAKVLEHVQKIREVISSLVLEEKAEVEENLSSNLTSGIPHLDEVIKTAIDNMISGNVSDVTLAGGEAFLDLIIENVLKKFDPSIQRLKQWSAQFKRLQLVLTTIADDLQKSVDEAADVSQVSIDLTRYKSLLVEIQNVKTLYTTEKEKVKARFLEALDRMTSAYQNRTGTDLSYSDVLSSLQSSTSALTPLLGDFYTDLSTVAKADGLKFEVTDPGDSDNQGGGGSSSNSLIGAAVVGTIVVVLAAFGISFYAYRRHRRHRLYTKI